MKGWKDKILFAKIQRCQKITDGLQKIKRYKTASKTYTTETAHQAERMHDHDVSWKFIRVNQCIWNFIWSEKRFFESIDVSGKCVDISKREKNPFNFATRFVCKECVISFTGSIMCLCKKLRLWKDSFKLWTLLQEDICHCDAWSKLAKKWEMCSMTWFSQVSMSQWGLPKDVTVIGIWWLGHFPSSQPPLPPFPLHHPAPFPPNPSDPGSQLNSQKLAHSSRGHGILPIIHHHSQDPWKETRHKKSSHRTPPQTVYLHTLTALRQIEKIVPAGFAFVSERAFKQFLFSGVLIVDLAKSRKLSSLLKNKWEVKL